ncbi:MAG: BON domain-containing protein [Myxococcota bacterium]
MRTHVAWGALVGALTWVLPAQSWAGRSDVRVTHRARQALMAADGLPVTQIGVHAQDGVVTLHGKVASERMRRDAGELVETVAGVREVRNLLQVIPHRQRARVDARDERVHRGLVRVFRRDRELRSGRMHVVSVANGMVLLGGRARNESEHLYALDRVASQRGVRGVISVVRTPLPDFSTERWEERAARWVRAGPPRGNADVDLWIRWMVRLRLVGNGETARVHVDSSGGVVTLRGTVRSHDVSTLVESRAWAIPGVRSVRNELRVVPTWPASRLRSDEPVG